MNRSPEFYDFSQNFGRLQREYERCLSAATASFPRGDVGIKDLVYRHFGLPLVEVNLLMITICNTYITIGH
jgi:hypothetical protein